MVDVIDELIGGLSAEERTLLQAVWANPDNPTQRAWLLADGEWVDVPGWSMANTPAGLAAFETLRRKGLVTLDTGVVWMLSSTGSDVAARLFGGTQ